MMVDKITTVAKSKLQKRMGRLPEEDMIRLNRAVLMFLSRRTSLGVRDPIHSLPH
jgi:mRNA interferase MazF